MGTGIVSVALSLDGERTLSRIFLALTAGAWLAAVALTAAQLRSDRGRLLAEAQAPAAMTLVAGTAVLGSRLEIYGARPAALAVLAGATVLWLGLLASLRRLPPTGASFMVVVAPQSLSTLAAATGLTVVALALCVLGLAAYPLALRGFPPRELRAGGGDHWVAGGALAISALALAETAAHTHLISAALHTAAVVAWVLGAAWLVALAAAEALWRRLSFDWRRWSTVFPVGMYAASAFEVGRVAGIGWLGEFARVWTWVAVAVWTVVAAGTILSRRR
jgi:tellurite resistance protein TehA-like permease